MPIVIGATTALYGCGAKVKTETYSNGRVKVQYQYYKNEANELIKHGPYTAYYISGNPQSQGMYKDDEKDGKIVYYFEEGTRKSEETYRVGRLHGPFTDYYEDGTKRSEGTYKAGQFHGAYTKYYANGQIELSIVLTTRHQPFEERGHLALVPGQPINDKLLVSCS